MQQENLHTNNRGKIITCLLLLVAGIKLTTVTYGMPYLFHPDEPYIFKDPFKILYNYKNLDFSSTTNMHFWVLTIWYSLYFIGGLITGKVENLAEFEQLLAAEDPSIIVFGRILSVMLSITGSYFLLRTLSRMHIGNGTFFLLGITLMLNPIELLSDTWIKFDPSVYCFLSILINLSYRYFIENESRLQHRIYFLGIVGLSLRVDLVSFFLAFSLYDLINQLKSKGLFNHLKHICKPIGLGLVVYMFITFLPLTLFWGRPSGQSADIPVAQTFESAILTKYATLTFASLIQLIWHNLKFYLTSSLLVSLGPLFIVTAFFSYRCTKTRIFRKMLLLLAGILFLPLCFFTYHAPHYFLLISIVLYFLYFQGITVIESLKLRYTLLIINAIYIGTLSLYLVYSINFKEDPRITIRDYMLTKTDSRQLIAIDKFLNAGYFPPINECREVLLEKVTAIKKYKMGTGKTFLLQAETQKNTPCRSILEVSAPKRFSQTEYEDKWAIDYDPKLMRLKGPDYFITMANYQQEISIFGKYILSDFKLDTVAGPDFADPRMGLVIANENYFPTFYIYKIKKTLRDSVIN